jgi:hypothetical protein
MNSELYFNFGLRTLGAGRWSPLTSEASNHIVLQGT